MTTTATIARGKYHIWTVGCQMNQADSQRIQTLLDELGWEETGIDQANLVILNTCSVRKAPEEKAHNQLAQLKHAKAKRNDLLVAMMGCMIGNQKTIDDLSKRYPHIDLFMKVSRLISFLAFWKSVGHLSLALAVSISNTCPLMR